MLISKNLHKKGSEVSIKTRSTPASLSFIGQVTKHTTVKWTIKFVLDELFVSCINLVIYHVRGVQPIKLSQRLKDVRAKFFQH